MLAGGLIGINSEISESSKISKIIESRRRKFRAADPSVGSLVTRSIFRFYLWWSKKGKSGLGSKLLGKLLTINYLHTKLNNQLRVYNDFIIPSLSLDEITALCSVRATLRDTLVLFSLELWHKMM